MLFFSLAPSPFAGTSTELSGRSFACGGHVCTLHSSGVLADDVSQQDGSGPVQITESLPGRAGAKRFDLLQVRFDPATQTGTLHRVSNSGRPLYYHIGADGSFYASTHLRLLRQVGIRFVERADRLAELLMYRMLMCPQTLVDGIQQLRAGETIEFKFASGKWTVRTTGIFNPPRAEKSFDEHALVGNAQKFLEESFLETNAQPERFGTLLSGGLDSSLLTKFASNLFGTKESFSCSYPFEDPTDDIEKVYAETAAANIGTKHHLYVPTMAQYLHGIIDTVLHAEQPMIHLQSVLLHLVFKHEFAPRGINIVANGEGADGIFGLKTHRFINYLTQNPGKRAFIGFPPIAAGIRAISSLTNRFGLVARMAGTKIEPGTPLTDPAHILWTDAVFGHWPWIRQYTNANRTDVVRGRALGLSDYADRDLLEQVSITAFIGEGTQTQLIWSAIGEPVGVGLFYPFPNAKLVDAAYRAPWSYKLGEPKKTLRDVARKLGIGEFIITRPKAAFGIRSERYGPRGSVMEPIIAVAAKGVAEPILRSLQSPEIYKAQTLWTMINLGIWRRLFINGEPAHVLHEELDAEMRRLGVHQTFNNAGRVAPMIP